MCNICGSPYPCSCVQQNLYPCNCGTVTPCVGTTYNWDFSSVIYHKSNNTIALLTYLGLTNGATLQLVAETIDVKLTELNGTIETMGYLGELTADPSAPENGQYWFRTDLAAANGLRIQLDGNVRTIPTT